MTKLLSMEGLGTSDVTLAVTAISANLPERVSFFQELISTVENARIYTPTIIEAFGTTTDVLDFIRGLDSTALEHAGTQAKLVKVASSMAKNQQFHNALEMFNAVASTSSLSSVDAASMHALRAWCLLKVERFDEADAAANKALMLDSKCARAAYIQFSSRLEVNKPDQALQSLESLLKLSSVSEELQHAASGVVSLAIADCMKKGFREQGYHLIGRLLEVEDASSQRLVLLRRSHLRLAMTLRTEPPAGQPPVSTDKCRTILVQALKDFEQEGARTTSVDAEWFARMAWNLAVETGRNDEYDLSGALFALSCKFDVFSEGSSKYERQQLSGLLGAVCTLANDHETNLTRAKTSLDLSFAASQHTSVPPHLKELQSLVLFQLALLQRENSLGKVVDQVLEIHSDKAAAMEVMWGTCTVSILPYQLGALHVMTQFFFVLFYFILFYLILFYKKTNSRLVLSLGYNALPFH
eukprot:m.222672 g.222672  ORF g.222672 m.222672 type:complete len:469 (+) comp15134_c0_seq53:1451-2857(+)